MAWKERYVENDSIEAITRREFLNGAAKIAGIVAAAKAAESFQQLSAEEEKEEQLKKRRKRFFGGWIRGGTLSELEYDTKVSNRLWDITEEVLDFYNTEAPAAYQQAYGSKAPASLIKDKAVVARQLLNVISIPDRDYHRKVRNWLKTQGTLNFERHKREAEAQSDRLVKIYKTVPEEIRKVLTPLIADLAYDAVDVPRRLFLLTTPVYDERAYEEIEKLREETIDEALQAVDNITNLVEGIDKKDIKKIIHQGNKLRGRLRTALDNMLSMQEKVLRYARHDVAQGSPEQLIYPDASSRENVAVYDFIANEWDKLNFNAWEKEMKEKIRKGLN